MRAQRAATSYAASTGRLWTSSEPVNLACLNPLRVFGGSIDLFKLARPVFRNNGEKVGETRGKSGLKLPEKLTLGNLVVDYFQPASQQVRFVSQDDLSHASN